MASPPDDPPDDRHAVREANALFYQAFEEQALDAMERLWSHGSHVACVHPGWPRLTGWPAIRGSWETIFRNSGEMRFTLTDVRVQVRGDSGWVSCTENILSADEARIGVTVILATNVFEREGDRWRLALHHASHVLAAPSAPPPGG